jgi:hypothetical protein
MTGGRQAWCPWCDELRAVRPGAACQGCGRRLLAVPPERPGQPAPGPVDRVARRLRGWLPAAGAVGVALLVVAAVAGAFAAGRLTRTTPSTPAASPAATVPGFADEGPIRGRRDFNWQAEDRGITVRLRSASVGASFTRLELHLDGVALGRQVSALAGLRVRDGDGNDLLPGGQVASISTTSSRPASGGGIDAEVVLDRALDQQAVATVELEGLTVGIRVEERLQGWLVDRELLEHPDRAERLAQRRTCPGCRLRVTCPDCRTVRVAGTAYRRGWIVVLLEAVGPPERSAVNPPRRRVVATGEAAGAELPAWIDGSGATAVVAIQASGLAEGYPSPGPDVDRASFQAEVGAWAEQAVRGRWTISRPGTAR